MAIAQLIVTSIIGVLAGVIAWQQWRLARDKFVLDLFDRRMVVYGAVRSALAEVMTTGTATDALMLDFMASAWEADFLFGSDVAAYNKQFYEKGLRLSYLRKRYNAGIKGEISGCDNDKTVTEESDVLEWFSSQYEIAKKLYGQYLKIDRKR